MKNLRPARAISAFFAIALALSLGSARARAADLANVSDANLNNITVDRIELNGVSVFGNGSIEEALEIEPGDQVDKARVLRTVQNLLALYHSHGYESVQLKTNLFRKKSQNGRSENVLEFDITEGDPTRVAAIEFIPESLHGSGAGKLWSKIHADLLAKATLAPGDIFDQDKISSIKRSLLDILATDEFIGAKADDIRVSTSTHAPPGYVAKPDEPTARWINIEFHVDLGDRVSFGYRGNQFFTINQLDALEEEQRVLGFGKDYIGAIQNKIIDAYKASGFAKVQIKAFTFEDPVRQERHVTYVITEGPRVTIDSLGFDGNNYFTSAELQKVFYDKASVIIQNHYYVEKDVQSAAEVLIDWLKSKGYLAAKLVAINSTPFDKTISGETQSVVKIVIYIYEGDQTIVEKINLNGVKELSLGQVEDLIGVKENQPLDLYSFGKGLDALKLAYRNLGYLGIRVTDEGTERVVTYTSENRLAQINLDISEGPKYRCSSIEIEGLQLTKEIVVKRELLFKEGEVLTESEILDTELRLRRLGIFSVVTIHTRDDPDRAGYKLVKISLQEAVPGVLAGGPGLRNDLGIRLFGQLSYDNLWGLDHTVSLNATVNHRFEDFHFVEYGAQLAYLWPYFALKDMTFKPSFTSSATQYDTFDATDLTLALTFEKKLSSKLTALFTYSLERVNQFNTLDYTDQGVVLIGSVTPALRLDLRDNPLNPSKGFFSFLSFDFAAPELGSQSPDPTKAQNDIATNQLINQSDATVGYYRVQWRNDFYYPILPDTVLFLSFRTGFERNDEVNGFIPLIKQFALGGEGSVRGFAEQGINIQNIQVRGTASYVNYRAQIDFPFTGGLKIGPFLDAANLNVDTFSFGNVLYGAGFGLHYTSPVGPIGLDVGFNLNPQIDYSQVPPSLQPPVQVYFSVGVI